MSLIKPNDFLKFSFNSGVLHSDSISVVVGIADLLPKNDVIMEKVF